jgi:hypothetical protein
LTSADAADFLDERVEKLALVNKLLIVDVIVVELRWLEAFKTGVE